MLLLYRLSYDSLYTAVFAECKSLRINAAKQLKTLPLSYFYTHDLTDLSQIIMADIATLEHAFSHAVPETYGMLLFMAVILVMLIASNVTLGLCIAIPVILSFIFNKLSFNLQRKLHKEFFDVNRKNSQAFQNTIDMQKEIKNFNLYKQTHEYLSKLMDEREKAQWRTEFTQGVFIVLASAVLYFMPGVILYVSVPMVQANEISILYVVGYLLAAIKLNDGLFNLYLNFGELMYADAPVQRLKELYQTPLQHGVSHKIESYDIQLQDVTFSYKIGRASCRERV